MNGKHVARLGMWCAGKGWSESPLCNQTTVEIRAELVALEFARILGPTYARSDGQSLGDIVSCLGKHRPGLVGGMSFLTTADRELCVHC